MKKFNLWRPHVSLLLTLCFPAITWAAQTPLTNPFTVPQQQTELVQAMEDDGFQLELFGSNKTFPDNRMMFTVSFQNTGYKASDSIDITAPVPPDTTYLENTANGEDCDILFSVDGGETWGTQAELVVLDLNGTWRAAEARDYTHIMWRYRPELRPAEIQQVSFQVKPR